MISLRWFLAILGAAALIVGLVALMQSIDLGVKDIKGNTIACGSALSPDTEQAHTEDETNELGRTLEGGRSIFDETDHVGDCEAKASSRKSWGIPLAIASGVLMLGALLVRDPRGARETPASPAEAVDTAG